jgi:hypothetical protein
MAATEPFEDTPNTVIKRLLREANHLPQESLRPFNSEGTESRAGTSGEKTPQAAFRERLIQALREMGGVGPLQTCPSAFVN